MEDNKLIAEFMGWEYDEDNDWYFTPHRVEVGEDIYDNEVPAELFEFNTSWDWLMPVITNILEKCSELDDMERYHCIIDQIPQIDHTYKAVVEFIKWYNKNK